MPGNIQPRHFAGMIIAGQPEGEVFGQADFHADRPAEQGIKRHVFGSGTGIPHRHLDAAEGALQRRDVAPGREPHTRQAAHFRRGDFPNIDADQPVSQRQNIFRPVAVRTFPQSCNTIIRVELDNGFGQRCDRSIAEDIGRNKGNVDRRCANIGDFHRCTF